MRNSIFGGPENFYNKAGQSVNRYSSLMTKAKDKKAAAAAAANGGAMPPDLSVMAKARHDGANYIYSLLSGYRPAPAGLKMDDATTAAKVWEALDGAVKAIRTSGYTLDATLGSVQRPAITDRQRLRQAGGVRTVDHAGWQLARGFPKQRGQRIGGRRTLRA